MKVGTYPVSTAIYTDFYQKSIPYNNTIVSKAGKADLVNYTIYRDDTELDQTAETSYLDLSVPLGLHTYYVVANYDNPPGVSDPSNEVEVNIVETTIEPPELPVIKLFPNPSSGELNLEVEGEYMLTVMNMQGILIEKYEVNEQTVKLDLSEYPKGIYMLRFVDGLDIITKTIVIQ